MTSTSAVISNRGRYTVFTSGDEELTFIAPYSLQRYEKVLEWDAGYLVVTALYDQHADPVEEYIDLVPVLKNLLMDPDEFLEPIKRVEVSRG